MTLDNEYSEIFNLKPSFKPCLVFSQFSMFAQHWFFVCEILCCCEFVLEKREYFVTRFMLFEKQIAKKGAILG